MGKELIVASNPRKRRSSPAQKAAARRNIKKAQAARRRSPARRRKASPRRRTSYKRKRNPTRPRARARARGMIDAMVMPALIGGAGAVANDMLVNFLPIPANLKTGWMRHVTKTVSAVGLAWAADMLPGRLVTKSTVNQLGAGALTVVGYNLVRDLMAQFMPNLPLGEYLDPELGYWGAGLDPGSDPGMGMYLDPNLGVVPGAGVDVPPQMSEGTPYLNGMGITWPTQVEEESGYEEDMLYG